MLGRGPGISHTSVLPQGVWIFSKGVEIVCFFVLFSLKIQNVDKEASGQMSFVSFRRRQDFKPDQEARARSQRRPQRHANDACTVYHEKKKKK